MDLRRLKHFIAVADSGSISRAAEQSHLSQPALSRQIQNFEQDLGVELFERVERGVRLTSAGQDLLERGRRLLDEGDAFAERARLHKSGDVGLLRVGATPQVLERAVADVLVAFRSEFPGVEVRLTEGHPRAITESLHRGELDLIVTQFQEGLRDSCQPAGVLQIAVVSRDGIGNRGRSVDIRELIDLPLLALSPGFGSRSLFDATCEIAHIRPNIIFECASPATLLSLAKAGYGAAILPTTVALPDRRASVRLLAHKGTGVSRPIAVHWNPKRHLPSYGLHFASKLADKGRSLFRK